jgi:hypothetical protein
MNVSRIILHEFFILIVNDSVNELVNDDYGLKIILIISQTTDIQCLDPLKIE